MTSAMFSMAPVVAPPWEKAVVTSGAGFLGSHLCERLLDAGVDVDCVDDVPAAAAHNVEHLAGHPGFRYLERDIARPGCPDTLPGPYDLVLHPACPAPRAVFAPRPPGPPDPDTLGTRNALAMADRDGARFVLASTCHTAARPDGTGPAQDGAQRFAEALTTAFVSAREADAGIVRLFPAYGPRMAPDDGPLIPDLVRQALGGGPVTVPGDGGRRPSLCYVDDTVEGVLLVAASRSVRPVDIGGEPTATVEEIARRVIDLTGSEACLRFTGAPDGHAEPRPQTGFAHEIFGWTPKVSLADGLKRTVADLIDRPARSGPRNVPSAEGGVHRACSW
ncbi:MULTISPECIES: NAD-dependent epimerase/dehydratase family protein [Streptomyces]|uniref:NAD-dependent epimerase/dehydratase family protein n=1 Tax=Streptomyces TaxID=1883 RepID=UPI001E313CCB|nr:MULTISPECIES: NAD-dependent epimerase/dehydratase family protein [Streptomyces]UFQ18882.1 NAD-dependent epimerase/dehydratase family protein [Streptomyces huasconensis]WCL88499.1 NAD-dependent epimerase/dehydratase family protein [Streptomyces sp. JCM 35825]